jgi:pyruvate dehydrogenase E2 component (dihydrolipoamide acetyltransferase)
VPTTSTARRTPASVRAKSTSTRRRPSVRTVSAATRIQVAVPAPPQAKAVPMPEANPVAVGAPPATAPAAPPAPPPASPANVPAPAVAPAPTSSGEPVEVEPSARRASLGAALNLLQAAAANSGEAVQDVVQELCLELVKTPLPSAAGNGEQLPFSCEAD